jgi:1-acyl-sn-glycerol-3-phosphate acyltransferase
LRSKIATLILRLAGWTAVGDAPPNGCVIVCAPHTSNLDYLLMILVAWTRNLRLSFLAKDSLFRPPLGWLMRATGGVPIDRSSPRGMVGQLVDEFEANPRLNLAVPAEGTRSRTEYWKSGFYRIAEGASVPISLAFIDRSRRESGFGPLFHPSGDLAADMEIVREFYSDKVGLKPSNFGPVRLREETPEISNEKDETARE